MLTLVDEDYAAEKLKIYGIFMGGTFTYFEELSISSWASMNT